MKLEEEKEKLLQTTKYSNTNRGQQQKTQNNNDDDDRENRNRKHINKQFVNVLKKNIVNDYSFKRDITSRIFLLKKHFSLN
jgi:hypothetical protein